VLEDADGSLLVVDTGGWYKICCPTSQLAKPDVLGGIFRIRKTGAPKVADPRGLKLPWATLPTSGLIALLADARPDVRDRAMQQLGQSGAAAVPALAEAVTRSPSVPTRRHAVWTLARIDSPGARAAVRPALADGDATVVQSALQVVSLWRDAGAFDALVGILARGEPAPARLAAEALGRIGDPRAVEPLLAAARRLGPTVLSRGNSAEVERLDPKPLNMRATGSKRVEVNSLHPSEVSSPELERTPTGSLSHSVTGTPEDPAARTWEHSLIFALIEIGRREPLLAHLAPTTDPRVARVALVALDQMEAGGLAADQVVGWLTSTVPSLRQTAAWVVSHRPDWGDALASSFAPRLAAPALTEADRDELQTQLAQLAKSAAIQDLLATHAAGDDPGKQMLALRAMAAAGLKETPPSWLAAMAAALARSDAALTRQAVATARVLPLPKAGASDFTAALARVGRNATVPSDVRLDALAAVPPAALAPVDAELFGFLRAQLAGTQPMLSRGAAATVLARAPLSPAQQLHLADTMKTIGALEAPKLLPAFEKAPTEKLGLQLIASLQVSPGLAGLRPGALRTLFAKYPPSVQRSADPLITSINTDATRQNARVDELLAGVKEGDVRRGQAVFNSPKTACTLCHVIGYGGGRLGPDLTNIGRIRQERELLEAILYPSASLVRGYEPVVVTTKNGETHSGITRKDASDEVILATGPESEQRIARADITDVQPGPISPMPPGMEAVLTPRELADLVVFLKSRQ
jgi:putative heme-binding domain-containing protein